MKKNMNSRLLRFFLAMTMVGIAGTFFLSGCDTAITTTYDEQIVVGAFIYANEPIDSIVLHRTTPFGSYYGDAESAVSGATVSITVDNFVIPFYDNGFLPGRYYGQLVAQPGKTYTISIDVPNKQKGGWHHLTATTTVPMPIHLTSLADSVRWKTFTFDTNNVASLAFLVTATPTDTSDHRYLLSVTARNPTGRIRLLRFNPDTTALTEYSEVATGPEIALTARLLDWFGENRITMYAIDTNWWDYQRQVTTFGANRDYQPTLNHVNGGMGIFGSAARDTVTVFIVPKQ
jgi:hypothetical protein